MNNQEFALEKFHNGCNCAQASLIALAPNFIDESTLQLIASPFGGGMAQQGNTRGAVTGALMALGIQQGYNQDIPEKKQELYEKANRFLSVFKEKHGTTICKELIGIDISDPNEKQKAAESGIFETKCPAFVSSSVQLMNEILKLD